VLKLDEATIVGQAETPAGQSVCPEATTGSPTYSPKEPLSFGSLKHVRDLDYKINKSDELILI